MQERRLFVGDFLYPHADWDDIMSPPGGLYAVQRGADLYAYLTAVQKVLALQIPGVATWLSAADH